MANWIIASKMGTEAQFRFRIIVRDIRMSSSLTGPDKVREYCVKNHSVNRKALALFFGDSDSGSLADSSSNRSDTTWSRSMTSRSSPRGIPARSMSDVISISSDILSSGTCSMVRRRDGIDTGAALAATK